MSIFRPNKSAGVKVTPFHPSQLDIIPSKPKDTVHVTKEGKVIKLGR